MPDGITVDPKRLQDMIRESFGEAAAGMREEILAKMDEKIEKHGRKAGLVEARREVEETREDAIGKKAVAQLEEKVRELEGKLDKARRDPAPATGNAAGLPDAGARAGVISDVLGRGEFADAEAIAKRLAYLEQTSSHLRARHEARRYRRELIKRGDAGHIAIYAIGLAGHRDRQAAIEWMKEAGYERAAQAYVDANTDKARALNSIQLSKGAVLVPEPGVTEFIELLYNRTAVRALGIRSVPMNGKVNLGRMVSGASSSWGDESSEENASEPTFGDAELIAKKLKCFVPISNDLIRRSNPSVVALVEANILNEARVAEDAKFLRGTGDQKTPKGLLNLIASGNKFNMTGSPTLTTVTADLGKAVRLVEEANIETAEDDGGWIFAPRTKWYLRTLRDTNGGWGFPEMQMGMLISWPYVSTMQVPTNLSTNQSEVYFVCASQFLIGDEISMSIDVSSEASYKDNAGTARSAFVRDETVIRLIHEADITALRTNGASLIQAVTWGV